VCNLLLIVFSFFFSVSPYFLPDYDCMLVIFLVSTVQFRNEWMKQKGEEEK